MLIYPIIQQKSIFSYTCLLRKNSDCKTKIHVKDVLALDACTFVYTVSVMQIYCCHLSSCAYQEKFEKSMKKDNKWSNVLMYPITNKEFELIYGSALFERPSGGNEGFGFHTRDD